MPDNLSTDQEIAWLQWEEEYGNNVVGDAFGEELSAEYPNLYRCSWCSLYSLAILILRKMKGVLPNQMLRLRTPPGPRPDNPIMEEFLRRQEEQISFFTHFLESWGIKFLRESNEEFTKSVTSLPWGEDRRIIGLRYFKKMQDVDRYILLWKQNRIVINSELASHRLVASRGIDLICSELLSNAFEHGYNKVDEFNKSARSQTTPFVLAKLCSINSSKWALELNERREYLSAHEKHFFEDSVNGNYPLLQLIIADPGSGFGNNKELIKLYNESYPNAKVNEELEAGLIDYALRPNVSTKKGGGLTEIEKQWLEYFKKNDDIDPNDFTPAIHGLSEVGNVIREMAGFWRIHSNCTIRDINYCSENTTTTFGRDVFGCLHYIMLPIKPEGYERVSFVAKYKEEEEETPTVFTVIDSGSVIYNNISKVPKGNIVENEWRESIKALREALFQVRDSTLRALVLLNLTAFDSISSKVPIFRRIACALLADAIYRCRNEITLFICGASDVTESFLRRTTLWKEIFFDRYIIPFIKLYEQNNECGIRVACSEKVEIIRNDLERILSPRNFEGIQRSDFKEKWTLLEEVASHNSGLFCICKTGSDDYELNGRIKLDAIDMRSKRLLLGGRSSKELGRYLNENLAIRILSSGSFMRYGRELSYYIHLASLWENREFRRKLMSWMSIASKNLESGITTNRGRDITFLALLHPAIEIAKKLLLDHEFTYAEISQIRRMSEIRWDSLPILKLTGRKVICVVDIINSGETIEQLVSALEYVNANILGILSVIQIKSDFTPPKDMKHFTFCECDSSFLKSIGERGQC